LLQGYRALHGEQRDFDVIPESAPLIAQYLLLYEMSGGEGDLDRYVDAAYQNANI
jgi:hypothetical protein